MINKILIFSILTGCIVYIIYTLKRGTIWDKDKTLYSNLFSFRAFFMALIFSLLLILMILKDYNLL